MASGIPVLVGLWDAQGDLTKASQRLESVGLRTIATDAAAIVHELTQLRLPLLQGVRNGKADDGSDDAASAEAAGAPTLQPQFGAG